mmetsp:Transcript_68630/g.149365  ORF Transcript_68630/g.149365 Transcript_68630/m.149365 type:complete len:223 (-) Transcript_68630:142-810(-)|eukprot:CAMPEP_0170606122 /NCGR_PEP_ID=MMETSP0224-20130122/20338_1 /TAXON_ID=285029 /ORGANISM="Togula jolla, Strain CCCM 725" /LENGTH=222 /DNA_ID=CAMNT_0010931171 /DNA_START=61 /DNA_END=729 /DNA_ORIENTATION=+
MVPVCFDSALPRRSAPAARRRIATALAGVALLAWSASSGLGFSSTSGVDRRTLLSGAVLGAAASAVVAPESSLAAEFPGLGKTRGAFEIDGKDAVVVGDAGSDAAKKAKAKVIELQEESEDALKRLEANPQEDLSYMLRNFVIADLRDATNVINNLMDDSSAGGTQRLQRLMINAKYRLADDAPFPVTKKGAVQARGPNRLERVKAALTEYVKASKSLLAFL